MIETRFKQTEVGAIPEDWEVKKLGEISQDASYGVSAEAISYDGKNKYIRITDIDDKYRIFIPSPLSSPAFFDKQHILKSNDILFARTGASVGKSYLYNLLDGILVFAGFLMKLNIQYEDSRYVFYETLTNRYKKWILQESMRSGQPGINIQQLKSFPIPLPPLPEQTRIAAALTSIDNLITSLLALIEKKKQLKQGTMQQLLTGKRRLPGFYGEWVEKKLGEICEFANGYTPSKEVASFWTNGTIPWFRMEDIRTNGRVLSDSIQHITKIAVKGQLFPSNSIIISTTATIGEHALIIVDSLANQQFTNLKIRKSLSKSISIDWLFHYCFVLGEWCRNNINEGGLAAVNMDDFSSHEMIMPPTFSEQTAIANVLTAMDNEIAALEAKRAKYEAIKQGMMQQLLTGRVRLCALHSGHCETQTNDKIASQSPR